MVSSTFYRRQYVDSDYDKPDGAQLIHSKPSNRVVSIWWNIKIYSVLFENSSTKIQ